MAHWLEGLFEFLFKYRPITYSKGHFAFGAQRTLMIMAIVLVRHGDIGKIGMSGGWAIELEALFLFGALAIALAGGGRFAPGTPAASRR